jgi:hypothetical protein
LNQFTILVQKGSLQIVLSHTSNPVSKPGALHQEQVVFRLYWVLEYLLILVISPPVSAHLEVPGVLKHENLVLT